MEEIDLKELIEMFLEKKFLIIFVVILFAILGAVYTNEFIVPKYESETRLLLVQTGAENATEDLESITTTDLTLNSKLVYNYIEVAKSKSVANSVIKKLKLDMSYEELQKNTSVSSVSDTETIKIVIQHTDPQMACKIANEYAQAFIQRVENIYKVSNVEVLDVAEVPVEPCNIDLTKNIVIFAFVGAILVSGYILLINMLDTTIKTDTDIEKAVGIPVLASIVLTEDSSKKKTKKSEKQNTDEKKSQAIPFSENVQFFYEDGEEETDEDNVSLFSYVNKDGLDYDEDDRQLGKRSANHKKNHRKGGR